MRIGQGFIIWEFKASERKRRTNIAKKLVIRLYRPLAWKTGQVEITEWVGDEEAEEKWGNRKRVKNSWSKYSGAQWWVFEIKINILGTRESK